MKSLLGPDCAQEWTQFIEFHQKDFEFEAGEVIIRQGDPVNGIYAIVEGKVKVVINDQEGERLLRLAANGDIFGHRGLGGDHRYPISAIALIPTTVNFISLEVFQVIAKTNPSFVYNLMMFLAEKLRASEELQKLRIRRKQPPPELHHQPQRHCKPCLNDLRKCDPHPRRPRQTQSPRPRRQSHRHS